MQPRSPVFAALGLILCAAMLSLAAPVASATPQYRYGNEARVAALFLENLGRFIEGKPLLRAANPAPSG